MIYDDIRQQKTQPVVNQNQRTRRVNSQNWNDAQKVLQ